MERTNEVELMFKNPSDTHYLMQPVAFQEETLVEETFIVKNQTTGITSHPQLIDELITIDINTPMNDVKVNVNNARINFNNGGGFDIGVDVEEQENQFILSVDGTYYYDHLDKVTTKDIPQSGHNFDTFVNGIPMPLDYQDNYATITLDFDIETYTKTNYQLEIIVGNEYPIRNHENALFNIRTRQGEFNTDNMKHVRTLEKHNMKHISKIMQEMYGNRG
jgi:hypothetical protein